MEKKIRVYDIDWDVSDSDMSPEEMEDVLNDLPNEVIVALTDKEVSNLDDEDEIVEYISNGLSDEYGFCHNGFNYMAYSAKTL